jgi:hypothetical protein
VPDQPTPPPIERPWDAPKPKLLPSGEPDTRTTWQKNRTGAIVLSIAIVVIVGIAATTTFVGRNDPKAPAGSTTTSATSGLSVTERDYVRVLGAKGPTSWPQDKAITMGRQVCDQFDGGSVGSRIVPYLESQGATMNEAVEVVFAAVVSFCPDYELDAQR